MNRFARCGRSETRSPETQDKQDIHGTHKTHTTKYRVASKHTPPLPTTLEPCSSLSQIISVPWPWPRRPRTHSSVAFAAAVLLGTEAALSTQQLIKPQLGVGAGERCGVSTTSPTDR